MENINDLYKAIDGVTDIEELRALSKAILQRLEIELMREGGLFLRNEFRDWF